MFLNASVSLHRNFQSFQDLTTANQKLLGPTVGDTKNLGPTVGDTKESKGLNH